MDHQNWLGQNDRSSLLSKTLLILILLLSGGLIFFSLTNCHNWGDDFAAYIMQAESVLNGTQEEFLEANRYTVEKSSEAFGPVGYPWGYPVLLAPFYAAFGENLLALKIPVAFSFLVFLWVVWLGFRKYHGPLALFALILLFAVNPNMLRYVDYLLSDIPFLVLSTSVVLLVGKVVVSGERILSPAVDRLLIGVLIAVALFFRTNGVLLIAMLFATQLIAVIVNGLNDQTQDKSCHSLSHKFRLIKQSIHFRQILLGLLPYFSFVAVAAIWRLIFPQGGSSHVSFLNQITLNSISHHLAYYANMPGVFFNQMPLGQLVYGASIPFAIAGIYCRFRIDYHIIIYLLMTFGLYVIWPPVQGLRFLFPILPFYFSFVLTGLAGIEGGANRLQRMIVDITKTAPVALVIFFLLFGSLKGAYQNLSYSCENTSGPYSNASREMFTFVENHIDSADTVIFFKPRALRLITGRKSIMVNRPQHLSRGDYLCVILSKGNGEEFQQISQDEINKLTKQHGVAMVFENEEFKIYRLKPATSLSSP